MEIIAVVRRNTRIWESVRFNLFPYRINVVVLSPSGDEGLEGLVRQITNIVSKCTDPVLILNEIPALPKFLSKGYTKCFLIPVTPSSSLSVAQFLQKTLSWLYKKESPPKLFVYGLPDLSKFLMDMEFPIVDLGHADFIISNTTRPDFPEDKLILLPFAETEENFIKFMTELLYNYVPPDVVKEKSDAEAEITKRVRQALLERRRKKK